ncbi:DUF3413 domain-containing protein [Actinobacillus equuli subsp. haemolyticus]|uniref:DUF3413 domain-containing protein n=1 Tax=Actinobacillus equuli TaxID=718 RepID=UPI002442429F|nr:DUF3413 domain-containing protein [Actinobacillus equuli]WGE68202.1 DUF3413 domain-containing protein [Actinobacillus equuli subsp. haemolyticus]WGE70645.1 DUF3413 domain-containing protein [Actinobacillus equuli subsp. haemolyticus]
MFARLRSLLPTNSRQYREETSQRITWGHWFTLFNVVLALLISSRYAFNADWPNTLSGKLYFFTSLFGHFSFIVFACYLLLLFPLSFVIKNDRTFRGVSVILATIGQTFLLVDTEVFKRFYLHLSPLVWDLLVNPEQGELTRQWQLLFVPMPLILLAEMLYSRWCWQKLRSFNRQKWGKYVAYFFLSCFTATHLIYAWADMTLYRPITAQKANYPLSHPMTARTFLQKHGLIDRAELQQEIEENGRLDSFYLNYPKHQLTFTQKPHSNILLINLSGLRNNAISSENTPALAEVSRKSLRFMQHYTSGDSRSAGVLGIFYSLSGKYLDSVLGNKEASPLMFAFRQSGYQFGLFSHNGFADPVYHQAAFAGILLPESKNNLDAISQWKQWVSERDANQPFFSYLDLNLPQANTYEQQTKLLDWQFSEIWSQLERNALLANTVVIITSDQANPTGEMSFAQQDMQVPLIIYWQGEVKQYDLLSSHLDIMPTLLTQFFGILNPLSDYSQGINLTAQNNRLWVLASNHNWNVAIMPDGEQYHIDRKGHFEKFNAQGEKEKSDRPPLPLFLQMIQQSNQFVEK